MEPIEAVLLPTIFTKRVLTDDHGQSKRYVDNEELTILGMLDSDGFLSLSSRVSEFIVLMTRITKV